MAQERKVPVSRSDTNLIEQEFDSVREKFEVEMRKMEEEMSRFRSQLIASEKDRLVSSSSLKSTSSSTCSRSSSRTGGEQEQHITSQQARQAASRQEQQIEQRSSTSKTTATSAKSTIQSGVNASGYRSEADHLGHVNKSSWLNELNSPLISDSGDGGEKVLKLRFDVAPYEPEQILVKTVGNRLQIHAKREEMSDSMSMYREYNREFLLPEGTATDLIRSSLSADGVLTVEAPLSLVSQPETSFINDH